MYRVLAFVVLTGLFGMLLASEDQEAGYLLSFEFHGNAVDLVQAAWTPNYTNRQQLPDKNTWHIELVNVVNRDKKIIAIPPPESLSIGMPEGIPLHMTAHVPAPTEEALLRVVDENGSVRYRAFIDARFEIEARQERQRFLDWMRGQMIGGELEGALSGNLNAGTEKEVSDYIKRQQKLAQRRQLRYNIESKYDCEHHGKVFIPELADTYDPCLVISSDSYFDEKALHLNEENSTQSAVSQNYLTENMVRLTGRLKSSEVVDFIGSNSYIYVEYEQSGKTVFESSYLDHEGGYELVVPANTQLELKAASLPKPWRLGESKNNRWYRTIGPFKTDQYLEFDLIKAVFFSGVIKSSSGGPAKDSRVAFFLEGASFGYVVKADDRGKYSFSTFPDSRYRFSYRAIGHFNKDLAIPSSSEADNKIDVTLKRGVKVHGKVMEKGSKKPLEGYKVQYSTVSPEGIIESHSDETGSDGRFPTETSPQPLYKDWFYHSVEAGPEGEIWEPPFSLYTDDLESAELNFEVSERVPVTISLKDPDGFPLPNGKVKIQQDKKFLLSVVADNEGVAELTLPRGSYLFSIVPKQGSFQQAGSVGGYLLEEGVSEQAVNISDPAEFTLKVNKSDIARVQVKESTANYSSRNKILFELIKNGKLVSLSYISSNPVLDMAQGGRYLDEQFYLPSNEKYQLRIHVPGRDAVTTEPFISYDNTVIDFSLPSVDEERSWSGTVFNSKGKPLKEVLIRTYDAALEELRSRETNQVGAFSVPACSGCTYRFEVPPGDARSVAHMETLSQVDESFSSDVVLEEISFHEALPLGNTLQRIYGEDEGPRFDLLFMGSGYTPNDEPFSDLNNNGVWDGVLYYDMNQNGVWDAGEPYAVYGEASRPVDGQDPTVHNEPFEDWNNDGYPNIGEAFVFQQNIKDFLRALFGYDYWREHQSLFRAWSWLPWSKQAGVNIDVHGEGRLLSRDTVFDATWSTERSLLSIEYSYASQLAYEVLPTFDAMVVFLNQPINVGRANSFVLANGGLLNRNPNSKGPGHEISHKLGSLQDEYGEFSGAFLGSTPKSMHLSRSLNKSQIPWRDYLSEDFEVKEPSVPGEGGIGVFEGGSYYSTGIYRPTYNTPMRNHGVFSDFHRKILDQRIQYSLIPDGSLFSEPAVVCQNQSRFSINLQWAVIVSSVAKIEVRVGAPDGKIFYSGRKMIGQKSTGDWVVEGDRFYLLDAETGDILGETTASVERDCPVLFSAEAVLQCDGTNYAQVHLAWDARGVDTELLNIRLGDKNGKLYSATSRLKGSTVTGKWVKNDDRFVLVNALNNQVLASAKAKVNTHDCKAILSALPYGACESDSYSEVKLSWDATSTDAQRLQIRLDDRFGKLYSRTSMLKGNKITGRWVSDGDKFVLLDGDSLELLAGTTARLDSSCRSGY